MEVFDVINDIGCPTGQTATREECHRQGLRHKAVVVFILNSDDQVLLQKRSASKKMWPNMWDVSSGGHAASGEFGFQTGIRECQEELGITLEPQDLTFIGAVFSDNRKGDIIDRHLNEYYIARRDVDTASLRLQPEEVSEVKWFDCDEIIAKVQNNYQGITDKTGCWEYLVDYYHWLDRQK